MSSLVACEDHDLLLLRTPYLCFSVYYTAVGGTLKAIEGQEKREKSTADGGRSSGREKRRATQYRDSSAVVKAALGQPD